jgi:hypothetical protein
LHPSASHLIGADLPLPDFVVPFVPSGAEPAPSIDPQICPHCQGQMIFIRTLSPRQAMAP